MVKQLTSYGSGFMAPAGERMVFAESSKLYSSSGSEATTSLIRDFAPASLGGTATRYGGEACLEVYCSTSPELWCTDGTSGGTRLVTARVPRFTAVSAFGRLFLVAGDAGLWVSDGTDAGTRKISTVRPSWAVGAGSGLLFFSSGKGLWRSDGTAAGTFPLRDFSEFCSNPFRPFVDGGVVTFFQADDGVHGCEPWQSDGTPGGTRMIADIAPGADNSAPLGWTHALSFDGDFYFGATDIVHGYELWRLRDGVVSLLSDFWAGAGSGFNRFIGDEAPSLISASTPATGAELFRMDVTRKPGCSLFLTRPLAGESWGIGDQLIAWAQEGGDCSSLIAIDLLKGNDVVNSIATSVDAKAGWVRYLPDSSIVPGTDYRVRVHDVANPEYEATSSYFSINADSPCSITLLTPNGGENWIKGDPQTISWRSSGVDCSPAVRIDLLRGTSVLQSIRMHADAKSGSTTFTPLTTPDGSDYFVRIQDELNSQFSDVSDAALTITSAAIPRCEITVVRPNGGETWHLGDYSHQGETVTVDWSLSGTACGPTVRVSLLKGGVEVAAIANGLDATTGTTTYTVPITLTEGSDYMVRVADTANGSVGDSSDLPFTVASFTLSC
jgi:ELWxxDGT repeat protein